MAGSIITQDELKELLHYDPDTGIFTRIKCDKRKDRIGEVAGGLHRFGYWIIKLNLKEYKAHRLAWLYMTERWPLNQIDHINRIRTDNRFSNLRECSNSENCKNMSKNKKNTSGYKGVSFDSRKKKWKARCSVDKVRHELGYFETAESANEAYCNFARIHHAEFYYQSSHPT